MIADKPHIRALTDWLRGQGATEVEVEQGRKHVRIWFVWRGVRRFYISSATPSDGRRSHQNALGTLRHMLGLVGGEKRVGKRRQRRCRAPEPPVVLDRITAGKDWTQALERHPAIAVVRKRAIEAAWVRFWRGCMADVGAESRL